MTRILREKLWQLLQPWAYAKLAATGAKAHSALKSFTYEVHRVPPSVHSSCGAHFSVTLRETCLPSKLRHSPRTPLLDPIASFMACATAIFHPHMLTSLISNVLPLRQVELLMRRGVITSFRKRSLCGKNSIQPFQGLALIMAPL